LVDIDDADSGVFGDEIENLGAQHLDPRISQQGEPSGRCPAKADDPALIILIINPDIVIWRPIVEYHGDPLVPDQVEIIDALEIDVGKNIPVDDEKGIPVPQIFNVFDGTARPQNSGFMADANRDLVLLIFYEIGDQSGKVVAVYYDGAEAGFPKMLDENVQYRPVVDRKEGLGLCSGIGQKAGAQPRCQDHRFHGR
jgi:hypothetical protein